jgi:hypothetical protein
MRAKSLILGVVITVTALACSATSEEEGNPTAGDDQNVTQQVDLAEQERVCKATSDCVAVQPFPCCTTTKIAVNQAARAGIEKKATLLCAAAFCAPELGPADVRTPACQEGTCVMVDPPPKPVDETIADDKKCQQASDCAAYEVLPCCSTTKDVVNQAGLAAAKQKSQSACLAAACAPDFGNGDQRVPACEAGECTLVFPE